MPRKSVLRYVLLCFLGASLITSADAAAPNPFNVDIGMLWGLPLVVSFFTFCVLVTDPYGRRMLLRAVGVIAIYVLVVAILGVHGDRREAGLAFVALLVLAPWTVCAVLVAAFIFCWKGNAGETQRSG